MMKKYLLIVLVLLSTLSYSQSAKEINGLDVTEITEFYGVDRGKIAEYNGVGMEVWSSGLIADGSFSIQVSGKGTLDWGDGNSTAYDGGGVTLTHTYSSFDGIIKFYGTLTRIQTETVGVNLHHDIALLPKGLTIYRNEGQNTSYGLVTKLPSGLVVYTNTGQNTTSGLISGIPSTVVYFTSTGQNTTSGLISGIPGTVKYYINLGQNTTSGSISGIPIAVVFYRNIGQNTVSDYTSGHIFASNTSYFASIPVSGGLDSTEVDNLLIDLESSGMSSGSVILTGSNAARTTASDVAVASLVSQGVTVTTNP